MRAPILILVLAASGAFAQQKDLNAAYERVRDTADLPVLIDRVGEEIKEGKLDAALADATRAVAIDPKNPAALNARAAALIELGRFDEASKDLDAVLAEDPDFLPARFNAAECLFLRKKYSDAAAEFRVLLTKYPENPLIKFKLYLAYHFSGRDDLSESVLESMRFPMDGAGWYFTNAAACLLASDKPAARRLMKTAEAIHPEAARDYREALEKLGLL